MSEQVCAVIATSNRRAVVQRCINGLRAQTFPLHSIIVIDNASTDDTRPWLEAQDDLQVITQHNGGSAGGFHTGMLAALKLDCDWLWLMDDDIIPSAEALQKLVRAVRARPAERVFNSLCLGIQDQTRPCAGALRVRTRPDDFFHGESLYTLADIHARTDADGLLDSIGGQLYQGTLLHRSVIEEIGTPLLWLFTRGDEIEYGLRLMRAGYHIWTVPASLVQHPDTPITYVQVFGKKLPLEQMNSLKRYYSLRNSIYLRRAYFANAPFLPYVVRRLIGALITEWFVGQKRSYREKIESSRAAARGTWDGIRAVSANSLQTREAYGSR